jgi:hypothetical protein
MVGGHDRIQCIYPLFLFSISPLENGFTAAGQKSCFLSSLASSISLAARRLVLKRVARLYHHRCIFASGFECEGQSAFNGHGT